MFGADCARYCGSEDFFALAWLGALTRVGLSADAEDEHAERGTDHGVSSW